IIWVLFGHGAFSAESADLAARALAAYAIGLPAFVLVKVLAPGFFARGDTATPVKIGLAAVALNLALNLAFMRPLQSTGPALATSLAAMFNLGGLGIVLVRRGQWRPDQQLRQRAPRLLAAAGVMAVALAAARHLLFGAPLAGALKLLALVALVVVGLLAYGVALQLLGAYDIRDAGQMLRRRALRRVGRSAISPPTPRI
ncbi:MAG TPA: lipid II flippase MurJ, partial [Acetobacteraceae bacterium]|nr:lipid II flippase MurJ [Acetobacteraceae bacterium]